MVRRMSVRYKIQNEKTMLMAGSGFIILRCAWPLMGAEQNRPRPDQRRATQISCSILNDYKRPSNGCRFMKLSLEKNEKRVTVSLATDCCLPFVRCLTISLRSYNFGQRTTELSAASDLVYQFLKCSAKNGPFTMFTMCRNEAVCPSHRQMFAQCDP